MSELNDIRKRLAAYTEDSEKWGDRFDLDHLSEAKQELFTHAVDDIALLLHLLDGMPIAPSFDALMEEGAAIAKKLSGWDAQMVHHVMNEAEHWRERLNDQLELHRKG